jgi:hypothetical protein
MGDQALDFPIRGQALDSAILILGIDRRTKILQKARRADWPQPTPSFLRGGHNGGRQEEEDRHPGHRSNK